MSRARAMSYVIGGGVLLASSLAHADVETARLSYDAPIEHGCRDEGSFRDLVVARLGRDPFAASGKRGVRVRIRVDGKKLVGRAEIAGEGGEASSPRELVVGLSRCDALTTALATSIALVLDPEGGALDGAEGGGSTPTPSTPNELPPTNGEAKPPPKMDVAVVVTAGPVFSIAAAPGPTLGGLVGIGVRLGEPFSVGVEGRGETMLQAARVDSGDRIEATLLSGSLVPCGHVGRAFACLALRAGAFQGRAPDVREPALGSSFFFAPGIRIGYGIGLSRAVEVRGGLEATLAAVRTSLLIENRAVWTAPPASAAAYVALVVVR